jgi:hypothetical protein
MRDAVRRAAEAWMRFSTFTSGLLVVAFALGCGGQVEGGRTADGDPHSSPGTGGSAESGPAATPSPTSAAQAPGVAGPDTTAPDYAVDATVTKVKLENAFLMGGAQPACPASSFFEWVTMTYDRGTHVATWHFCDDVKGAFVDAQRTLAASEVAKVEASLAAITYVENPACAGMDGKITMMTTTTAAGVTQLYVDANVNCYTDGRRGAPKLDDTFELLKGLR